MELRNMSPSCFFSCALFPFNCIFSNCIDISLNEPFIKILKPSKIWLVIHKICRLITPVIHDTCRDKTT